MLSVELPDVVEVIRPDVLRLRRLRVGSRGEGLSARGWDPLGPRGRDRSRLPRGRVASLVIGLLSLRLPSVVVRQVAGFVAVRRLVIRRRDSGAGGVVRRRRRRRRRRLRLAGLDVGLRRIAHVSVLLLLLLRGLRLLGLLLLRVVVVMVPSDDVVVGARGCRMCRPH